MWRPVPRWTSRDVQADQLGDAHPGLDHQRQQGAVAAAEPGGLVGRGEQRGDLGEVEVADDAAFVAFGRDRHDPRDRVRVLGMLRARRIGRTSGSRRGGRCGCGRLLPRSCSRWVKNAPISGASRSSMSSSNGCLPVCACAKRSSSLNVSR